MKPPNSIEKWWFSEAAVIMKLPFKKNKVNHPFVVFFREKNAA